MRRAPSSSRRFFNAQRDFTRRATPSSKARRVQRANQPKSTREMTRSTQISALDPISTVKSSKNRLQARKREREQEDGKRGRGERGSSLASSARQHLRIVPSPGHVFSHFFLIFNPNHGLHFFGERGETLKRMATVKGMRPAGAAEDGAGGGAGKVYARATARRRRVCALAALDAGARGGSNDGHGPP